MRSRAGSSASRRRAELLGVKLAWGADFLFMPAQNKNQNADLLKLKQWFSNAEIHPPSLTPAAMMRM